MKQELNVKFKFRVNPEAPRGQVAITENRPGEFLVMAKTELSDAQIIMAIARYVGKHEKDL
jgi:hypothetical protein